MTFKAIMAPYAAAMSPEPTPLSAGGRLNLPVRVVLFDIYGTLLISASGDIHAAVNQPRSNERIEQLLHKYHVRHSVPDLLDAYFSTVQSAHDRMRGQGIDVPEIQVESIWMKVLQTHDLVTARRFAVEFEMIVDPTWPMPHARETIAAIRQTGIILGIISNAQFYTPHLFDLFFEASVEEMGFDPGLIFYSFIHGRAKPSPEMFEKAADRIRSMGFEPGEAVYVGNDMKNDILPSRAMGFQTVLFAGDRRSLRLRENDPGCMGVNPDLVITDLAQFPAYLNPGT